MTMTDKEYELVVRETMHSMRCLGWGRRVSVMDWTIPLLLGFLMGVGVGVVFG